MRPGYLPGQTCLFALAALLASVTCSGPRPSLHTVMQDVRTRHPDVHEITTGSLAAAIEAATRPRIIDARAGEEFEVSHLPGARWIGAADALAGLDPRTDPVVVYCSVGYRSAEYARHLAALGFRHARNLSGGIFKWANEGRPLQAPRGAPAKVHGFSASWQHLLAPHLRHLP